jgi:hypothetical protein
VAQTAQQIFQEYEVGGLVIHRHDVGLAIGVSHKMQ